MGYNHIVIFDQPYPKDKQAEGVGIIMEHKELAEELKRMSVNILLNFIKLSRGIML